MNQLAGLLNEKRGGYIVTLTHSLHTSTRLS